MFLPYMSIAVIMVKRPRPFTCTCIFTLYIPFPKEAPLEIWHSLAERVKRRRSLKMVVINIYMTTLSGAGTDNPLGSSVFHLHNYSVNIDHYCKFSPIKRLYFSFPNFYIGNTIWPCCIMGQCLPRNILYSLSPWCCRQSFMIIGFLILERNITISIKGIIT